MRTYGGIYDQPLAIDHTLISKKAGAPLAQVHQVLLQLHQDDLAAYEHTQFDTALTFLVQREDDLTINRIAPAIKTQNTRKINQVKSILQYVENNRTCRSIQLLAYFEENQKKPCGICDVCLTKSNTETRKNTRELKIQILQLLKMKSHNSHELAEALAIDDENLLLEN